MKMCSFIQTRSRVSNRDDGLSAQEERSMNDAERFRDCEKLKVREKRLSFKVHSNF